jgi:TolB-like protein
MTALRYSFGPFVLDCEAGALTRDGKPVVVSHAGLSLLEAMLQADGKAVPKAELMDRAWPRRIVEEGNLTVQIAALRKALGNGDDGRDWIATVPRVGYRITRAEPAIPGEDYAAAIKPALAVLPFANLGGDPEQDYFADGVVEDIITALSRFTNFAVIARNSSFTYKGQAVDVRQVAKELGVRYVLEGSVRRGGDRLRITTQLVEGAGGAHLWAQTFDGALDDVFEFQDRITEAVATIVSPYIQAAEFERARRERPGSIAAYDSYLAALPKILAETESENTAAYALLTDALALDPNNGLLLAYAAWVLEHRTTMGWPPLSQHDRQKCFEFARRGLENAAGDPVAMTHCAMALLQVAREYDWGMAVLNSALAANPNSMTVTTAAGVANLHCGSVEQALALLERSTRLSPRDPFAHLSLTGTAHAHMILGNYEEAISYATRSIATNPNFDASYWMLTAANAQLQRMDQARHFLGRLLELTPGLTLARIKEGQPEKDPSRLAPILEGLGIAGLPEG